MSIMQIVDITYSSQRIRSTCKPPSSRMWMRRLKLTLVESPCLVGYGAVKTRVVHLLGLGSVMRRRVQVGSHLRGAIDG